MEIVAFLWCESQSAKQRLRETFGRSKSLVDSGNETSGHGLSQDGGQRGRPLDREANLSRTQTETVVVNRWLEFVVEFLKIAVLATSVVGVALIGTALADDLPRIGYAQRVSVKELATRGYRWVTVNGPYACATKQELRKITSDRTDLAELHMVEDGGAYYLMPGTLVRVIRDDQADGMSEILLGGVERSLWTYSKFLTARPIRDIYGIVETPDTAGLIDPSDAALAGSALNERSRGETP